MADSSRDFEVKNYFFREFCGYFRTVILKVSNSHFTMLMFFGGVGDHVFEELFVYDSSLILKKKKSHCDVFCVFGRGGLG